MKYTTLLILAALATGYAQERSIPPLNPAFSVDFPLQPVAAVKGMYPHDEPILFQESGGGEKKSVALAAFYSFLLPGMGELYADNYSSGKYFTIAEGILWITLGAVEMHANSMQDDARLFAVQHAGVSLEDKNDDYFVDIGNYNNVYSYNTAVLRARQYFNTYNPRSSFAWQWDVDANRTQYRDLRVASDEMFNNTKFVAGAIVLNHVVSAINAIRATLAYNKSVETSQSFDCHASVIGSLARPEGIMLSFSHRF